VGSFEYFQPANLSEAMDLLAAYGERAVVMAGGTDVMVALNAGELRANCIIGISEIKELKFIKEENGVLRIGPSVTMAEITNNRLIKEKFNCLWKAAMMAAGPQVRNLGTIGGNLGTASPAGDFIPPLMALDSSLIAVCKSGESVIKIADFFSGPKATTLQADSLIREIRIPFMPKMSASSFEKLGKRKAMSISVASAAAVVTTNTDKTSFANVKIALGSLAPTVVRAQKAEERLRGRPIDQKEISAAAEMVREEIRPMTDGRATAWYRSEVSCSLVRKALWDAISELGVECQ
jgi:CO/xanthine dehydrogenase FAD-binding subunit